MAYIIRSDDKLYIAGTPATAQELTLVYWPRIDASAYTTGTTMPFNGRFDDIVAEYVTYRAKNIDEMNVSQDAELLQDMENNVLATYATVARPWSGCGGGVP